MLQKRGWTIMSIVILIPLGFLTKFYSGPASLWVNYCLGGVLYVVFWTLFFSLVFPRMNPLKLASIIFIITCILEILQLWHPAFLETVRSHFLGRALIGTSFSWIDFIHYLFGFIISFGLLVAFRRMERKGMKENPPSS